jgi:hypothetical protein
MRIDLPPALFHGIGLLLIVFGTLRAYRLGWQRRLRESRSSSSASEDFEDSEHSEHEDAVDGGRYRPDPAARRHIMFGVLWVAMGIFLVVSTLINSRR